MAVNLQHFTSENLQANAEAYKIFAVLKQELRQLIVQIRSFHYRSATLQILGPTEELNIKVGSKVEIDIYFGRERQVFNKVALITGIHSDIDPVVSVSFIEPMSELIDRSKRIIYQLEEQPIAIAPDPLARAIDTQNMLEFIVKDISSTGMLLASNKSVEYLHVGMVLSNLEVHLEPDRKSIVDVRIENVRSNQEDDCYYVGVSILGKNNEFTRTWHRLNRSRKRQVLDPKLRGKSENLLQRNKSSGKYRIEIWSPGSEDYKNNIHLLPPDPDPNTRIAAALIDDEVMTAMAFRVCSFQSIEDAPEIGANINATHFQQVFIPKNFMSPEILISLVQMVQAISLKENVHGFVFDLPESSIEQTLPVNSNRFGNKLFLSDGAYSDEYLNPMVWTVLATKIVDWYIADIEPASIRSTIFERCKNAVEAIAKKNRQKKSTAKSTVDAFVNPKWTEQHLLAIGIYPYIQVADEAIGSTAVDRILNKFQLNRSFLQNEGNWISVAFLDNFLEELDLAGADISTIPSQAAQRFLNPQSMGIMYHVAKHFVSPSAAFKAFEAVMPRFDKSNHFKLVKVADHNATVALAPKSLDLVPEHNEVCGYWLESFSGYIHMLTGKDGNVVKTQCVHRGDNACVYEISWHNRFRPILSALKWVSLGALLFVIYNQLLIWLKPAVALGFAVGVMIFLFLAWKFVIRSRQLTHLRDSFDEFQKTSNERYAELQKTKNKLDHRYREAKLLQETSKMVQSTDNLIGLFDMTLKNICHNFSFKSAFILLANEDRTRLVPYAGTVSNRSEQQVVAPISTDLETTNVFSTVFHTGQSAIVELSEANNRLFCGQSRELVNYFQLNRFLVLVIEAQQKYGVLIAEKDGRNEPLGQTDVVLLNRIATQAAMALDKQSRIDNESKLRNLFQKYVPREIIESISQQNNQGRLGGEVRTIVAMILDIRGFTKLSHEVSPPMALELLNRFFSSLYKVVQDRHGLIDKFLGDGALVTWGAIGSRSPESQKENIQNAFYAANEMLDAMDILNDVFGDIGLPRINIGIGMHVGPAVVGNVGAEERLEFTSIGTTVNLASRLEQLSKELKSDLVVSADIINQLPPTETRHLVQAQHQVVRGLEQPVDVYYLKKTELKKAS